MKPAIALLAAAVSMAALAGPVQAQTKPTSSAAGTMTEEQKSGPTAVQSQTTAGTKVSKGHTSHHAKAPANKAPNG